MVNSYLCLPHAFHIYNKQGKYETIDTLLLGKDIYNWWKAVVNELGRLANSIDNRVQATKHKRIYQKGGGTHGSHSHIFQCCV